MIDDPDSQSKTIIYTHDMCIYTPACQAFVYDYVYAYIYDYVCVYICICIGKCNFSYKIDIALTHKSVAVAQRA